MGNDNQSAPMRGTCVCFGRGGVLMLLRQEIEEAMNPPGQDRETWVSKGGYRVRVQDVHPPTLEQSLVNAVGRIIKLEAALAALKQSSHGFSLVSKGEMFIPGGWYRNVTGRTVRLDAVPREDGKP